MSKNEERRKAYRELLTFFIGKDIILSIVVFLFYPRLADSRVAAGFSLFISALFAGMILFKEYG